MPCYDPPRPTAMEEELNKTVSYLSKQHQKELDRQYEVGIASMQKIRELTEKNTVLADKLGRLTELLCTLSRDIPEDQMPDAYKEWTLQHLKVDVSRLTEEVIQRALNNNDIPLLKQIRDALEPLEEPRILEQEA